MTSWWRSIAAAIGLEDVFIVGGTAGLAFVAWQLDWLLGVAVVSVVLLALGILFAR